MKLIIRYLFLGLVILSAVFIWGWWQSKKDVVVNITEQKTECVPYQDAFKICDKIGWVVESDMTFREGNCDCLWKEYTGLK